MRWQLMMAQLAQPVQTKEGARDYQRAVQDLLRATEGKDQKEFQNVQDKKQFEDLMGFSFVRGSKGGDESESEDESEE